VLSFGRSSTGSGNGGEGHHERASAWPDDPGPSNCEQQERLRELQVLTANRV
jgi:hypothetical protein